MYPVQSSTCKLALSGGPTTGFGYSTQLTHYCLLSITQWKTLPMDPSVRNSLDGKSFGTPRREKTDGYFCAGVATSFRYAGVSVFLLLAIGSRVG
jgi:hypothetical protein